MPRSASALDTASDAPRERKSVSFLNYFETRDRESSGGEDVDLTGAGPSGLRSRQGSSGYGQPRTSTVAASVRASMRSTFPQEPLRKVATSAQPSGVHANVVTRPRLRGDFRTA